MKEVFFDLNFINWQGILLALIPAFLNLCIIIYILVYMPGRAIPRTFGLFTLSLFLWQMDDAFSRMSNTAQTAALWDQIFCLGWMFVGPIGIYFSLLYTGRKELARSSIILGLIFLPTIIFEAIFKLDIYPHLYIYSSFWGWVDNHNLHMLDELMIGWISLQVITSSVLLIIYAWKNRKNPVLRYPAFLIAIGIGIPTVQGLITQVIFPIILKIPAIPLTSTFLTVFAVFVAVALSRYRLFSVAESVNMQMLLNNMTDIVFTISPEYKITFINSHGASLLGLNASRIIYYQLSDLFRKNESEAGKFKELVLDPAFDGYHIENKDFTFRTKDDNEINVLVSADPIYDNNNLQGVLLVAHNISEIKIAENILRQKNKVLERSNMELESFAFVASHDMKEPLRMVSNYTQLLAKKYKDKIDPEANEYINYAVEGVHRMQALIKDLVTYTSIGMEEMVFEKINVSLLIKDVLIGMEDEIQLKGAVIKYADLPEVNSVEKLLKQLFRDLITNALKFVKENTPPRIEIRAEENETEYIFSVQDNGIGIAQEYEKKVFMMFQRLNDREKFQGTGIGLTICRKITELLGGRIWLKSELGKGSTFYFTIPK